MIIGIDYRFAAKTVRGIGTYIREIVSELINLDKVNEYILYVDEPCGINHPDNFKIEIIPHPNILLFEQIYLPIQAKKDNVEVLWYPSNSGPLHLHKSIKLVVTVHDLIVFSSLNALQHFSIKGLKFRLGEYYRRYSLQLGISRINQITTVSEFSALEIVRLFKKEARVIPNNVKPLNSSCVINSDILINYQLKSKEYLYTMTGEAPHKNLKGLLELIAIMNISQKFVISGVSEEIGNTLSKGLRDKIIFTGYITEEEKMCLYQNSSIFLFLSLFEGFGIPLLEAMQFNIPIIAYNNSSIPEILGDGGVLIKTGEIELVKQKIIQLLSPKLNQTQFVDSQMKQLNKYSSWKSSAKNLLNTISSL